MNIVARRASNEERPTTSRSQTFSSQRSDSVSSDTAIGSPTDQTLLSYPGRLGLYIPPPTRPSGEVGGAHSKYFFLSSRVDRTASRAAAERRQRSSSIASAPQSNDSAATEQLQSNSRATARGQSSRQPWSSVADPRRYTAQHPPHM